MGFFGHLKFAVLCAHILAWPVFALGYPLFASIRAIETGSKYHMRKLVTYWAIFSLISLFEFAFVKIIEWIPLWSSMKLVAIMWLVLPRFDGACYAYQSLVRPYLSVNPQAVIDRLNKPNEEKPRKTETFLDVVEKYVKENGSEALEKLLASKGNCKELDISQKVTPVLEPEKTNGAVTSKLLKEPDAAHRDNVMLKATEESVSTEGKLDCKELDNSQKVTKVLEPKMTNAAAISNLLKEADAAQRVNVVLKATEKSASTEAKLVQQHRVWKNVVCSEKEKDAVVEIKEMTTTSEENARNRLPETPPPDKFYQEWNCPLCQVTTTSEKTLNIHLQGKKHKSKCESLKASKLSLLKEMTLTEESAKNKQIGVPSKQEWKCHLCQVTTTGKNDLNAHFLGQRHKSKCESLKTSKPTTPLPTLVASAKNKAGEGSHQSYLPKTPQIVQSQKPNDQQEPNPQANPKQDVAATQPFTLWCNICSMKLRNDIDMDSHLKGKRHLSNVTKSMQLGGVISSRDH